MSEQESTGQEAQERPAPQQSPSREERGRESSRAEKPSTPDLPTPDIPVSQLTTDASALLGVSSWVAAGALREHDADELMSIDSAKGEVENWLQQPVRTPKQEEE